ncbi:697_t:CDS:2 [Cetraspora pellucida]|uniref:697_t:CDS:1 n=1 Tax=Cetraspora pellucida TaxID=1433469 RepID=A0ACA9M0Q9_9GLOM|nr:697_t:CDS:2 [Cetraspora pellucida]
MSNQQKQRRTAISDDLKRQICEWAETNKDKRHHEIASYFNERAQNKKILLLVDNAPSHFDPHDQDDNDDGINDEHDNFGEENSSSIRSRGNFRKGRAKMSKSTYVDAWSNVSEETISNCWKKTGILPVVTESDITNVTQIQQDILTHENEDINQMIVDNLSNNDPYANSLANALNDFFHNLDEKVLTEDFLNENDIISLIQDEMCAKNESPSHSDDSEEEPELVSLSDASKSL